MTPKAMVTSTDNAILPRRYQEEIFQKAQESNVIAALDTGSGKTFICTMLIRWVTSCDSALGKVVVFLVPKVPLVEQQGDFIAKQTPLRVCKLHGVIGLDMTDRAGWREKFKAYDVFVSTGVVTHVFQLTSSVFEPLSLQLKLFSTC
jgi:endoribonuclease Dicer